MSNVGDSDKEGSLGRIWSAKLEERQRALQVAKAEKMRAGVERIIDGISREIYSISSPEYGLEIPNCIENILDRSLLDEDLARGEESVKALFGKFGSFKPVPADAFLGVVNQVLGWCERQSLDCFLRQCRDRGVEIDVWPRGLKPELCPDDETEEAAADSVHNYR